MALKIASINIELSRHLPLVETFLHTHQPDVLCLQELCARDIPLFENIFRTKLLYVPMMDHPSEPACLPVGIGIIARRNLKNPTLYSYGEHQPLILTDQAAENLLCATVEDDKGSSFRIATTHVRVTVEGASTPAQRAAVTELITLAQTEAARAGGLLLTGDFNAPRGRQTFALLAAAFTDGVPAHYTTSIDGNIHKAGPLPYMVDGLFHTPTYSLTHATLHPGVSDHMALTATLSRSLSSRLNPNNPL